jgi:hypothetical protein
MVQPGFTNRLASFPELTGVVLPVALHRAATGLPHFTNRGRRPEAPALASFHELFLPVDALLRIR